jgi:hypothetical protein
MSAKKRKGGPETGWDEIGGDGLELGTKAE